MHPQTPFCHHPAGCARGQRGPGHIVVHSHAAQRDRCQPCGHTLAATTGPPCYRLPTAADVGPLVRPWRCQGCPIPALGAALGLDERPVAAGVTRAGRHGQPVPPHVVQPGQVDRQPVQADALWVQRVGRRVGLAMALAVPSRLWRGGWVRPPRDRVLRTTLVQMVRSGARSRAILVGVDGLARDVTAFLPVFRDPGHTGGPGRPRLGLEPRVLLGQVVQRDARRRGVRVAPRAVRGTVAASAAVLEATGSGTGITTAALARLDATFRRALTPLVRRGRAMAQTEATLSAGRWRVGWADHFCCLPGSLRVAAPAGAGWKWPARTPAMAAGLTNGRWTMRNRLRSQVPLSPWVAAKRRGRPPTQAE
jgi:hypothetical protein